MYCGLPPNSANISRENDFLDVIAQTLIHSLCFATWYAGNMRMELMVIVEDYHVTGRFAGGYAKLNSTLCESR
jgi:hypothetical protein